jgi:hypothetical protein
VTDRPGSPDGSPDPEAPEPTEPTEPTPPSDPSAIADVRRLLADARHTGPMPDHVVARMDRVLASLGDETATGRRDQPAAVVVPIAAQRRRRAAALLVAAAAVVVGGVVLGPHLPHGGSASPSGASAGDTAGDRGYEQGNTGSAGQTGGPAVAPTSKVPLRLGRVVVRPQQFPSAALQGQMMLARRTQLDHLAELRACSGLPHQAKAVPAEYQHAPAALVYRRAVGSSQVVDLYVCGSSRPIRSTTLPAP